MSSFPATYKTETTQDDYAIRFNGPFKLLGREHDLAFGYVDSKQKFDADSLDAQTGFDGIADFDAYSGNFAEPVWGPRTDYGYSETRQKRLYAATRLNVTLSAQVNADNITDQKYFDIFDAYGALTYGAPRSITASAKYRF